MLLRPLCCVSVCMCVGGVGGKLIHYQRIPIDFLPICESESRQEQSVCLSACLPVCLSVCVCVRLRLVKLQRGARLKLISIPDETLTRQPSLTSGN